MDIPDSNVDKRYLWMGKALNPPPEPEMTFDEWYAEFLNLLNAYGDAVGTLRPIGGPMAALMAHARKRIRP